MKLANYIKQLSVPGLSAALASPTAYAHPGHETGTLLHGVLHTEHLLLLLAIGMVIAIGIAIRD